VGETNKQQKRPDMSGDLLPWKFDPIEEVVEITAHSSDVQSLLIFIRVLYLMGLLACTALLIFLGCNGDVSSLVTNVDASFAFNVVIIWALWKLLNEIRFFAAFVRYRKSACAKWWSKKTINP
jgi:hypothetical protein